MLCENRCLVLHDGILEILNTVNINFPIRHRISQDNNSSKINEMLNFFYSLYNLTVLLTGYHQ